eukprot:TRINITY_DN8432_c0_g1_i4.p1 TRINITY_DN8432_c0_g1~~TRINITY_DN8432_c0_g1_i4.p1  ORF type:complete len:179 (+),score=28.80 TRINITY_DN8432_c0_g1_i4:69-539(+)
MEASASKKAKQLLIRKLPYLRTRAKRLHWRTSDVPLDGINKVDIVFEGTNPAKSKTVSMNRTKNKVWKKPIFIISTKNNKTVNRRSFFGSFIEIAHNNSPPLLYRANRGDIICLHEHTRDLGDYEELQPGDLDAIFDEKEDDSTYDGTVNGVHNIW